MSVSVHASRGLALAEAGPDADAVWNQLALATPQPDPFCATTHWQLSWREAIEPDRPLILRQCEDGLVHLALHRLSGGGALGPIERRWLFGCNLLGPGALELLKEIIDEIDDGSAASPPLVISGLEPGGPLLASLKTAFARTHTIELFRRELQCAASLDGGLDGFLSRRSGNFRRNLRRAAERAYEFGVVFERHAPKTDQEADAVFARMLAVELTSWKGLGRCGMEAPSMVRFYSTMLRRLARSGEGRVIIATHEGCDIGFIFGGLAGALYRGQQFSFDERWADFAIGNLMQFEKVKWLCEDGVSRYDLGPLLGPSMEYKYRWTERQLPIEAWIMSPL